MHPNPNESLVEDDLAGHVARVRSIADTIGQRLATATTNPNRASEPEPFVVVCDEARALSLYRKLDAAVKQSRSGGAAAGQREAVR